MNLPHVVSPAEWEAAHAALLVKEKQATRARDALAAQRRRLPMVRVEKQYAFEGPDGEVSLLDLFDGRRQLIVYHHMLQPGDTDPCSGCSMVVDNIGHLATCTPATPRWSWCRGRHRRRSRRSRSAWVGRFPGTPRPAVDSTPTSA